jgi:chromosome segregation ATPase
VREAFEAHVNTIDPYAEDRIDFEKRADGQYRLPSVREAFDRFRYGYAAGAASMRERVRSADEMTARFEKRMDAWEHKEDEYRERAEKAEAELAEWKAITAEWRSKAALFEAEVERLRGLIEAQNSRCISGRAIIDRSTDTVFDEHRWLRDYFRGIYADAFINLEVSNENT